MKVYKDGNSVLTSGAIYHIFMLFAVASRGWAQVGVIDESFGPLGISKLKSGYIWEVCKCSFILQF